MSLNANFGGEIGRIHAESTPWWPPAKHPGDEAPNVVVVLFDDLGFSHLNCFGSDMVTPNIDKLASNGLRFSNFHVTPLCSPTRAALLTGRNHHTVGMRSIANFNTGYPHMTGRISENATTNNSQVKKQRTKAALTRVHHPEPSQNAMTGRVRFAVFPLPEWVSIMYYLLECLTII